MNEARVIVTDAWGHDSVADFVKVSLDLEMKMKTRLKAPSQQDRQKQVRLTSLRQETQLGVLGTPSASLYTGRLQTFTNEQPRMTESRRLQPMASYRVALCSTSYYVIMRHHASS
jgi:hypothetical protein